MARRAWCWVVGGFAGACGAASQQTTAEVAPTASLADVAVADVAPHVDDAWHGEGCRTITSRDDAQIDKIVVVGRLHSQNHCYLDLAQPLCLQYAGADAADALDDAGLARVEIGSIRFPCDGVPSNASNELELRGSLSGAIAPIVGRHGRMHGWTVEAHPTSVERVMREVALGAPYATLDSLKEMRAQLLSCFADGPSGHLTLDIELGTEHVVPPTASGRPPFDQSVIREVKAFDRVGGTVDLERCAVEVARRDASLILFDGTKTHVLIPVTFTRMVGAHDAAP